MRRQRFAPCRFAQLRRNRLRRAVQQADLAMPQRDQVLDGGPCAVRVGVLTLRHLRLGFDIHKNYRLVAAQRLDLLRFRSGQRQINHQRIDALRQQFVDGLGGAVVTAHGDHQMVTVAAGTLLDRRGDLRRRHQRQIAGGEPERARRFARQLLRHAVWHIVELLHGRFHFRPRARGDLRRMVKHAGNGLVGDAGKAGDVIKSDSAGSH